MDSILPFCLFHASTLYGTTILTVAPFHSFFDVAPLKDIEAAVLLHSARSSVYVRSMWDSRRVVICRFAHNQSGGKTSNGRDSNPKYLGIKKYGW